MKLVAYNDPGHGWLRVPLATIAELDAWEKFSQFSYLNKRYAYLEEDCDAPAFLAMVDNVTIQDKYTNNSSRIRNYAMYTPDYAKALHNYYNVKKHNSIHVL